MMAAQRCASLYFRPVSRQIKLWTSRSRLYSWSSCMPLCQRYPRALPQSASSHWMSPCRNPLIQNAHMLCSSSTNAKTGNEKEFRLIYRFPGIRICKVVSKLKILQTSLTFMVLPPVFYFYLQGQMTQFSTLYVSGIALFAGVMLYSLTYYLRRIVGMIYVNQDATTLRVAHLTFWGNRKDIYFPVEGLKKLSETGDTKGEVLLRLQRYSCQDVLYFTLRYGQVLDKEMFRLIFGEMK